MQNGKIKVWLPAIRVGTGTDIFTLRLAESLIRRGVIAEITWFPPCYELMPSLLKHVCSPRGTDVVFANSWNGFAFKRTDIPLVVTVHHSGSESQAHSYRTLAQRIYHHMLIEPFERRSYEAANVVTAVSKFSADNVMRLANIEKVEAIYNWIDTVRFQPLPEAPKRRSHPFRLLFVGKFSRSKGADLLVPIMRELGSDFELCIAGRLQQQYSDMPDNVRSLGWLNEEQLIQAYQESDALLFPSQSEGFGYAALEAMACAKPVIASNSTALPEVVANGITGLLCRPGDASDFVRACRQLAANPQQQRNMGQAGRQKAIEEFSEAAVIPRYLSLINQLTVS